MNTLPPIAEMERAYLDRDPAYNGLFFVGVRTTAIFCRPTCPVRSPLPENVEYFPTAAAALFAGYRPCKRCRPMTIDNQPEWALAWLPTPLGPMIAGATDEGVCLLEFSDRQMLEGQFERIRRWFGGPGVLGTNPHLQRLQEELAGYFTGSVRVFSVPLVYPGTPFQRRVWEKLLDVPYGETQSYQDVASAIGDPKAVRAVGRANGMNRIGILIPCHRIVNKNGDLGGYGGGLRRKQYLLNLEQATVEESV